MSEILDLRPVAVPGWRVAVAQGVPAYGERSESVTIIEVPLIGWAQVAVMTGPDSAERVWLPCWWDDLGLTTGNPWQEVAWPLGPLEELTAELRVSLNEEVRALLNRDEAQP